MSLPPQNTPSSSLWSRLTQLPRPHQIVQYPKRLANGEMFDAQVAIVVLTESELMSARAAADAYAKEMVGDKRKAEDLGYVNIYNNELMVELVVRACKDVSPDGKVDLNSAAFPNPVLARKWMTSDEFAALFQAYCDFQAQSGPLVSQMTKEEMDAWVERLGEGASYAPLAVLSSAARDELLMHSAAVIRSLRTDSGSAGLLQSEQPSEVPQNQLQNELPIVGDGEAPPPPVLD